MEMHTVKWTDTKLNGRLWSSSSEDGRWYIEHLDLPGTPWGVFYCDVRRSGDVEELVCEAARLPTIKDAKRCVESGTAARLAIAKLEKEEAHVARMVAASNDASRRVHDRHENARSVLAGARADLLYRQPAGS